MFCLEETPCFGVEAPSLTAGMLSRWYHPHLQPQTGWSDKLEKSQSQEHHRETEAPVLPSQGLLPDPVEPLSAPLYRVMGETFTDQAFPVPAHPTGECVLGPFMFPGGGMDLAGLLL